MEFFMEYCNRKVRLAPFRLESDYEYKKTVGVIDALLERALNIHRGQKSGSRFGWEDHYRPDDLMARATELLATLEAGQLPLDGKYSEPGGALVDHTFVEVDGVMHVFYNRAFVGYDWPERFVDTFGHAVSEDLIHWTPLDPVFSAMLGGHDDHQVWSPGIVKRGDTYYMFYTGVNFHVAQAICLATSKDLVHWDRCPENPIFIPGDWCPWSADRWSDCRDGMVFCDDDGMSYMYYCTTRIMEDGSHHNALGIASSSDLVHWQDDGCIIIQNCDHFPESPYVMKRGDMYYMFFTNVGKGTAYATSRHPVEGWTVLPYDENLLFPGCTSEVFSFKGEWYISNARWLGTGEQYLEIAHFNFHEDGSLSVGDWLRRGDGSAEKRD